MKRFTVCILLLGITIHLEGANDNKTETSSSIKMAGPWSIQVGPGKWQVGDKSVSLSTSIILAVAKPKVVRVRSEKHSLPAFNETKECWGWLRGVRLDRLMTQECSATDLLIPGSVKVKSAADSQTQFVEHKDFKVDVQWATLGRTLGSAIQEKQVVCVDYDYSPSRLDAVVVDKAGRFLLIKGTSAVAGVLPPVIREPHTVLANIWVPGRTEKLTPENLFPIQSDTAGSLKPAAPAAQELLPKTLMKLRQGKPLTILSWGDSVTNGTYLRDPEHARYQVLFAKAMRKRFPQSKVTLLSVSWPGANSLSFLDAPRGSEHEFDRVCLAPKPDLVTIEFVNDAPYSQETFQRVYASILDRFKRNGAELILITPHLIRPDWMGITTLKVDEDPRPYVKYLKEFSRQNHIALADASRYWTRLWRKGIPYTTLLTNSINHPDERGHQIFAQALIELFP